MLRSNKTSPGPCKILLMHVLSEKTVVFRTMFPVYLLGVHEIFQIRFFQPITVIHVINRDLRVSARNRINSKKIPLSLTPEGDSYSVESY
jgi:hypothetical protein